MSKYSVNITYRIRTVILPGENTSRSEDITPLSSFDRVMEFDSFIDEVKWIKKDILDIMSHMVDTVPGDDFYVCTTPSLSVLSVKLTRFKEMRRLYEITYKHVKNDVD